MRARARLAAAAAAGAAVGSAVGGAAMLYAIDPATSRLYPRCPFLLATGCYCPGCGAMRAMHQLLRGHVVEAFGHNPLLVAAIPVLLAMVIVPRWSYSPRMARIALAVILVFGVARNVPVWPFVLLRP